MNRDEAISWRGTACHVEFTPSTSLRMTMGEGLTVTEEEGGRITGEFNKQPYIFQPPDGEVIKNYYLVRTLQQFRN